MSEIRNRLTYAPYQLKLEDFPLFHPGMLDSAVQYSSSQIRVLSSFTRTEQLSFDTVRG